uniref:Uncharacterized protein n=1 Tax=Meloidogyne enterolobii TaxID=390850 RepID=A0A6V7WLS3_MELEN|nr:unnamed protein product [Meloidogyne enterolobii]
MLECETCKTFGYRFDFSPTNIRAIGIHIASKSHEISTKLQIEEQARKEHIANTIREIFGDDDIPTGIFLKHA